MSIPAGRLAAAALIAAAAFAVPPRLAAAGEIADQAKLADTLLGRGYAEAGLAAFDKATAAFWEASPLQLRVITFADSVGGFGDYVPRAGRAVSQGRHASRLFRAGRLRLHDHGDEVRAGLAVDVQIRTPGGLILATANDFARLEWKGRRPMHEVHADRRHDGPGPEAGRLPARAHPSRRRLGQDRHRDAAFLDGRIRTGGLARVRTRQPIWIVGESRLAPASHLAVMPRLTSAVSHS